jgi:Uma2 family endonuclease
MILSSLEIVKQPHFESFEDYLAYDDNEDRLYELFNGRLVEVPPESGLNVGIATKLLIYFAQVVGHLRVRGHGLELEVEGEPRNRYPDLTIIKEEHVDQLLDRNTIRLSMAAPDLVVEVVSPGSLQRDRDYVAKRSQYQSRNIPVYWIVDPQIQQIMVLTLNSQGYQEQVYRDGDQLPFQGDLLNLTVADIFMTDIEG